MWEYDRLRCGVRELLKVGADFHGRLSVVVCCDVCTYIHTYGKLTLHYIVYPLSAVAAASLGSLVGIPAYILAGSRP